MLSKINGNRPSWDATGRNRGKPVANPINDLFDRSLAKLALVESVCEARIGATISIAKSRNALVPLWQFVSVVRSTMRGAMRRESHTRFANTLARDVVSLSFVARVAIVEELWQGNAITFDYWESSRMQGQRDTVKSEGVGGGSTVVYQSFRCFSDSP